MNLKRVLEPEVMDTPEEAIDYNNMDHSAVNKSFVADLLSFATAHEVDLTSVLDLGTGTALIPIELCNSHPDCSVTGIDMAEHMLAVARKNVERQTLQQRIKLERVDAKGLPYPDDNFQCVMTNSIIHHIPDPEACITELIRVASPGGMIFVRDLMRPSDDAQVRSLVKMYAGDENAHSQKMFDDSLRAALSLTETQDIVSSHGFETQSVVASSDRHWTWAAIKPRY